MFGLWEDGGKMSESIPESKSSLNGSCGSRSIGCGNRTVSKGLRYSQGEINLE